MADIATSFMYACLIWLGVKWFIVPFMGLFKQASKPPVLNLDKDRANLIMDALDYYGDVIRQQKPSTNKRKSINLLDVLANELDTCHAQAEAMNRLKQK